MDQHGSTINFNQQPMVLAAFGWDFHHPTEDGLPPAHHSTSGPGPGLKHHIPGINQVVKKLHGLPPKNGDLGQKTWETCQVVWGVSL